MSNNILDQPEKYTGFRTCPNCGDQFPFGKFVSRFVMSYGLSKWYCRSCGKSIRCDFIKIQFFWLLSLLPSGLLIGFLIHSFDWGWLNILFLIPSFAFVLLTLYYAKFEEVSSPT